MLTKCQGCGSDQLRTYSSFNNEADRWEWWKGCNKCDWQSRDEDEEKNHPEYYERTGISPAKINSNNIRIENV